MLTLRKTQVPDCLKGTPFYEGLDDSEDTFLIPKKYLSTDLSVTSKGNLWKILSTLRFWGSERIPEALIDFCLNNDPINYADTFQEFSNELKYLDLLTKIRRLSDHKRLNEAIKHGLADVVHYLSEQKSDFRLDKSSLLQAAKAGNLATLALIHRKGLKWIPEVTYIATENGYIDCLMYAHQNGCPWHKDVCVAAAEGGFLYCLEYAHKSGCKLDKRVMLAAARKGRLLCMQYLYTHDCVWDPAVCTEAAAGGHLECLVYARQQNCPWAADVCTTAAENGHLACLKYAHKNGAEFNGLACKEAALRGRYTRSRLGVATNSSGYRACIKYLKSILSPNQL